MMQDPTLTTKIQEGAQSLNIDLTELALSQLCQYVTLLQKWNQKINLTRLSSTDQIITHHIFDAFSIINLIEGQSICDVGTGAGDSLVSSWPSYSLKNNSRLSTKSKKK